MLEPKNLSLKSLKDRLKYLIEGNKIGSYQHHAYKEMASTTPLIEGKNQMYQLFLSYIYVKYSNSCTLMQQVEVYIKKSFSKFYKIIKDKKIVSLIKNSEK